jgi:hypothetical protein
MVLTTPTKNPRKRNNTNTNAGNVETYRATLKQQNRNSESKKARERETKSNQEQPRAAKSSQETQKPRNPETGGTES